MSQTNFDPGGYFEFDLAKGAVRSRDGERLLVLSDNVVAPLVSAAVEAGDLTAVRRLGRQLGASAKGELGGDTGPLPAEDVLGAAAGLLGIFGWGRLTVDRWGDALVAILDELPGLDTEHLGVAALLGGLFSSLSDREVACVPVSNDGIFLVVDPSVAQQIWKWSRAGDDIATIVGRLAPEGA